MKIIYRHLEWKKIIAKITYPRKESISLDSWLGMLYSTTFHHRVKCGLVGAWNSHRIGFIFDEILESRMNEKEQRK